MLGSEWLVRLGIWAIILFAILSALADLVQQTNHEQLPNRLRGGIDPVVEPPGLHLFP